MAPTIRTRILQVLGVAILVTTAASQGGDVEPNHIRTATIGGVRGPVYYSVVDGNYQPVAPSIGAPQQLAVALPPLP